jgi:hypothetical protein
MHDDFRVEVTEHWNGGKKSRESEKQGTKEYEAPASASCRCGDPSGLDGGAALGGSPCVRGIKSETGKSDAADQRPVVLNERKANIFVAHAFELHFLCDLRQSASRSQVARNTTLFEKLSHWPDGEHSMTVTAWAVRGIVR